MRLFSLEMSLTLIYRLTALWHILVPLKKHNWHQLVELLGIEELHRQQSD
jgi:hypothetical protein